MRWVLGFFLIVFWENDYDKPHDENGLQGCDPDTNLIKVIWSGHARPQFMPQNLWN